MTQKIVLLTQRMNNRRLFSGSLPGMRTHDAQLGYHICDTDKNTNGRIAHTRSPNRSVKIKCIILWPIYATTKKCAITNIYLS